MSLIKTSEKKPVFGVIVGNRDVFPAYLAKQGRLEIISVLKELGYNCVVLNDNDTKFGVVETYSDAKKCAELFKKNKEHIIGIIIVLPNFGDEVFFSRCSHYSAFYFLNYSVSYCFFKLV